MAAAVNVGGGGGGHAGMAKRWRESPSWSMPRRGLTERWQTWNCYEDTSERMEVKTGKWKAARPWDS